MPQGGGGVYFVPPEYTGLGGIAQGLKSFIELKRQKEQDTQQKEAQKSDIAWRQFQTAMQLGNKEAAARVAATSGLLPDVVKPGETYDEMVLRMTKERMEGKNLGDFGNMIVNQHAFGTLDPELAREAQQAGIDLTKAQVDLTNTQQLTQEVQRQLSEKDLAERTAFVSGLDQGIFNDPKYAAFKGSGVYGWAAVKDQRDYWLRAGLTAAQIKALEAQAARDNAELEMASSKAGSQELAQTAGAYARSLLTVGSMGGDRSFDATAAFKYAINKDDPSIAPAAKAGLDAAAQVIATQTHAEALKALQTVKDSTNLTTLQAIVAMGKNAPDAAKAMLNAKNADGTTVAEQLMTGIFRDMYGPDAVGKMKQNGLLWDKEITTVDLSNARTPADLFAATLAENTPEAEITPEETMAMLDQMAAQGADLQAVYNDVKAIDPKLLTEADKAGLAYLESKYGMGATEAPTKETSTTQESDLSKLSDEDLKAAWQALTQTVNALPTGEQTIETKRQLILRRQALQAEARRRRLRVWSR